MADDFWTFGALAFMAVAYALMARVYARIYGHKLRWWAVPFSHGALLFARRLPDRWEKR